jgi:hypothetical protein
VCVVCPERGGYGRDDEDTIDMTRNVSLNSILIAFSLSWVVAAPMSSIMRAYNTMIYSTPF